MARIAQATNKADPAIKIDAQDARKLDPALRNDFNFACTACGVELHYRRECTQVSRTKKIHAHFALAAGDDHKQDCPKRLIGVGESEKHDPIFKTPDNRYHIRINFALGADIRDREPRALKMTQAKWDKVNEDEVGIVSANSLANMMKYLQRNLNPDPAHADYSRLVLHYQGKELGWPAFFTKPENYGALYESACALYQGRSRAHLSAVIPARQRTATVSGRLEFEGEPITVDLRGKNYQVVPVISCRDMTTAKIVQKRIEQIAAAPQAIIDQPLLVAARPRILNHDRFHLPTIRKLDIYLDVENPEQLAAADFNVRPRQLEMRSLSVA